MSRIVTGLVRAGLVRRMKTVDRRKVRLEPTAKGSKILHEGRRRRVELLAQALQTLSESDLQEAAHLAEFMLELVRRL